MNEILQKRIEEAAEQYSVSWRKNPDGSESKELFPVAAERSFKAGATFALQNQWISVDEALPKESGDYLVIVKQSSDSEAYFHEISTYNATDNIWFYVGKLIVTHWAPIPSLEGGRE
jgi:hypothetical protein